MTQAHYAIEATDIYRRFGEVHAVEGVSLAVSPGEIYGFLGPNGAGKTTMLRVLTTLLLPSSGSARVAGFDVVSEAVQVRLKIGTALQDVGLDPKQSGLELLRLQGSLYGLSRRETNRRIDELEHLVDIGDAMNRLIGTYSGGMKRRLDLAASLIHAPEVLFLDEPTTGLDPISRARVWDYVRAINREMGVTIFLTTQYLEEADALAERVGIINHGVVSAEGTPRRTQAVSRLGRDRCARERAGAGPRRTGACAVRTARGRVRERDIHLNRERRGVDQRRCAGAQPGRGHGVLAHAAHADAGRRVSAGHGGAHGSGGGGAGTRR